MINNEEWLEEYEELMFGDGVTQASMARAADMKHQNMPDLFFKYRTCSDRSFDALEHDFLFSSQPSAFNDIFESAIEIDRIMAGEKFYQRQYDDLKKDNPWLINKPVKTHQDIVNNIIASCDEKYGKRRKEPLMGLLDTFNRYNDNLFNHMMDTHQRIARNMYNVCCFCSINDNETMWAYYADSHTGFCIGYDFKSLENDLNYCTFPVLYKDKCTLLIDDVKKINGRLGMHLLTEKSTAWKHEKEWRTLFKPSSTRNRKEMMPVAKAVYLGARISKDNENRLIEICNRKGISIYKMVPKIAEYKLIPVEI